MTSGGTEGRAKELQKKTRGKMHRERNVRVPEKGLSLEVVGQDFLVFGGRT